MGLWMLLMDIYSFPTYALSIYTDQKELSTISLRGLSQPYLEMPPGTESETFCIQWPAKMPLSYHPFHIIEAEEGGPFPKSKKGRGARLSPCPVLISTEARWQADSGWQLALWP